MSRITDIRRQVVEVPLDPPFRAAWDPVPRRSVRSTVVEVVTDDGRIGIGGGDRVVDLDEWRHLFVGEDPHRIEHHVRVLETIDFHGGRPWPVEMALWDLLGQAAGLPCSVLLGGVTDRLPAYASTGELVDPDERVRRCREAAALGFAAVKLRVDPTEGDAGIEVVAAVRDALPELAIMVDLNQGWRMAGDVRPPLAFAGVVSLVRRLADLEVTWVEEPLPMGDRASLAALRRAGHASIAGGEMVRTAAELHALLDADALDVFQPDVVLSAGITRVVDFAAAVRARGRRFTPHTWSDGLGLLANLHVAAGVGAGPFLEVPFDPPGWSPGRRDPMLRTPLVVDGEGNLVVPDRPGLGIDLDRDRLDDLRIG